MKINVDDLQALPSHRLALEFNEELEVSQAVKPVVGELVLTFGATGMRMVGNVKTLLKLTCQGLSQTLFSTAKCGHGRALRAHRLNGSPV